MRFLLPLLLLAALAFSEMNTLREGESIPWRRDGFDPSVLMRAELPDNFSVHHVFTFGVAANSLGYARSGGSYTSVMEYYISPTVLVSAGIGFSTLFWSKSPSDVRDPLYDRTLQPELNVPFVALDWQVSNNASVHFMFSDGSYCDAFYCDPFFDAPYYAPYRPYRSNRIYRGTVDKRPVQRNAIFKP